MKTRQASPECTQPIRGSESQTSYPRVQWENTLDKKGGYRIPHTDTHTEGQRATVTGDQGNVRSRNNQGHRTTHITGS